MKFLQPVGAHVIFQSVLLNRTRQVRNRIWLWRKKIEDPELGESKVYGLPSALVINIVLNFLRRQPGRAKVIFSVPYFRHPDPDLTRKKKDPALGRNRLFSRCVRPIIGRIFCRKQDISFDNGIKKAGYPVHPCFTGCQLVVFYFSSEGQDIRYWKKAG